MLPGDAVHEILNFFKIPLMSTKRAAISPGENRNVLRICRGKVQHIGEQDIPTLMRYPDVFNTVFQYLPRTTWNALRLVCKKFYRWVTRHSHATLVLRRTPEEHDLTSFLHFNPRSCVTVDGSIISQSLISILAGVHHITILGTVAPVCLDMHGCSFTYLGRDWLRCRYHAFTPETVVGFDDPSERLRLDLTPFYQAKYIAQHSTVPYDNCRALFGCLLAAGVHNYLIETSSWCAFPTYPLCLDFNGATVTLNSSFANLVLTNVRYFSQTPLHTPWENPARVLCTNDWWDHIQYEDGLKMMLSSITMRSYGAAAHKSWDYQPLIGVPEALIYLPDDG
jgi:hypothetical protein